MAGPELFVITEFDCTKVQRNIIRNDCRTYFQGSNRQVCKVETSGIRQISQILMKYANIWNPNPYKSNFKNASVATLKMGNGDKVGPQTNF